MLQKQKTTDPDEPKKKDADTTTSDPKLKKALSDGKSLADRLDQAAKRKSGHWEHCCGAHIWVED